MTIDPKAIRERALRFPPGEHGCSQCVEDILGLMNEISRLELDLLQAGRLEHELTAIIEAKDEEIEKQAADIKRMRAALEKYATTHGNNHALAQMTLYGRLHTPRELDDIQKGGE